jgi:peptide chain release factor subunit 1
MEKRHNYVRKVAETAVQLFISNDKVHVSFFLMDIKPCVAD